MQEQNKHNMPPAWPGLLFSDNAVQSIRVLYFVDLWRTDSSAVKVKEWESATVITTWSRLVDSLWEPGSLYYIISPTPHGMVDMG